jgi:hypothetical protein
MAIPMVEQFLMMISTSSGVVELGSRPERKGVA